LAVVDMAGLAGTDVERVRTDPAVRLLHEGDQIVVGEFHCRPQDPRWSQENCADEGHFVVFPGTTVVITNHGEEPMVTTPNQVMLYNKNQSYRRALLDPQGDHCVFFMVAPEVLSDVATVHQAPLRRGHGFRFPKTHGPVSAAIYLRQRLVARTLRSEDAPDRLGLDEAAYRVIGDAVADALGARVETARARPGTERAHALVVEETKALLAARYAENLSLRQVAAEVLTSPFHLARIFRGRTGFGIHEYRNQLRLRRSLDLLFETPSGLTTVAHSLGYSSHSHFTDSFRRVFRVSPSRARLLATMPGSPRRRGELEAMLEALR
jgi:AraC family transcriptional regulator